MLIDKVDIQTRSEQALHLRQVAFLRGTQKIITNRLYDAPRSAGCNVMAAEA